MAMDETNEGNDTQGEVEDLTKMVSEYEELFAEQEAKIKQLEAEASQSQSQSVQQSQGDLREQWNQKFFENPSETTYALIQSALQSYMPIINQQMQPAIEQVSKGSREEVRKARKDYDTYEPAINEILKTFSPQNVTPQVVDAAYLVAKGYDTFGDYKSSFIEGSSGYSIEDDASGITELTPAQKRVAERFNIREEDYLNRIKRIEERKRRREESI